MTWYLRAPNLTVTRCAIKLSVPPGPLPLSRPTRLRLIRRRTYRPRQGAIRNDCDLIFFIFLYTFLRISVWHSWIRVLFGVWILVQLSVVIISELDPGLSASLARASFGVVGALGSLIILYLALREEDCKLIAAHSGECVLGTKMSRKASCQREQHAIPNNQAEGAVDVFEPINVNQDHCRMITSFGSARFAARQSIDEELAIRKSR